MNAAWTPGVGWRGWSALPGEAGTSITSARLPADAPVKNRFFPKTRSWFALGAPLELMSPLSVLRILYAMCSIIWPAVSFGLGLDQRGEWLAGAVWVACLAAWGWQLRVREVGLTGYQLLSGGATVMVAVLVLAERGGPVALCFVGFLVPLWVMNALFLRFRTVIAHTLLGASGLLFALLASDGMLVATSVAMLVGFTGTIASGSVMFLVRANKRQGAIDPDTGLPNTVGLAQHFQGKGSPERLVLAAVLLEGIGEAREALGHRVAIELLRRAVEHLGQVLPSGTVIGRLDGDELVFAHELAPSATSAEGVAQARALARTLAQSISRGSFEVSGIEVSLRPHVGLALFPDDGDAIADLIRRAGLGARAAATRSRTDALLDEHHHEAMTAEDLSLLASLSGAAARGELCLVYQPQVDAQSGRTLSVEALLRWESPSHGTVSPSRFIPLAERTGLIDRVTSWVLSEALDAQSRWRARGLALPVSVNFSAKTLTRDDLAEWILGELKCRDLPPSALAVEVTETAESADLLLAVSRLRPLHEVGVRISIDDFGTGYTSLSVLPQLPLNELKVDQGFVLRSLTSAADDAIVRTVGELAHRLGLTSVAEGVENEEIRRLLTAYGYDVLQGYVLARPLLEERLLEFVAEAAELRRAALRAEEPKAAG